MPAHRPADLLAEANGAQQTLNQGLRLVTPLVGAGLFAAVGGGVIAVIDAGTFGVAVASPARAAGGRADAGGGPRRPAAADRRRRRQVATGTAGVRGGTAKSEGDRGSRPGSGSSRATRCCGRSRSRSGLVLLAFGFTESAGFSVVTAGLHHSASFVGVLMTVQGPGRSRAG